MKRLFLLLLTLVIMIPCGASAYVENMNNGDAMIYDELHMMPHDGAESVGTMDSETTVPETIIPETIVPETTVPETTVPETTVPETTVPETAAPETVAPETTVPETAAPETTAPETAAPETAAPETTPPETLPPETEPVTEPAPIEPAPMPQLALSDKVDPARPMLALTFDDGPSAHTDRLLDILNANGARATFFVVGNHIDYRPATVRRIVTDGHEIGGHSWTHTQLTKLDRNGVWEELAWTRDKIYEVTGAYPSIMRPPYGAYNDTVKSVGLELGIALVNWSVDTLDWKTRNADAVYEAIISSAYDGAVILCHDIHKTTVDAMETVIPRLIEDGYQLVTFSEMMATTRDSLVGGGVYNRK